MVFIQRFENEVGVLFDKLVEQLGDPDQYAYPKLSIWKFENKVRNPTYIGIPQYIDKYDTEFFTITLDGKNNKLFVDARIQNPLHLFNSSKDTINDEFEVGEVLAQENIIEWIINLPRKKVENQNYLDFYPYTYTTPTYIGTTTVRTPYHITAGTTFTTTPITTTTTTAGHITYTK